MNIQEMKEEKEKLEKEIERKIEQFEEQQLNKLLVELKDIDNFKGFENGEFKYSLGKYQANLLLEHIDNLHQRIKELENINDKLSSALESAEQKIDKIIKYIENREFKDKDFPLKDIKNLAQGKEID